ncbi:MAG: FAD-dependent oxidoreductase [Chloroflexi bacterium]|nr:FAD-dependent oxidoreductase [Chloroflexota bacterium]
MTKDTIPGMPEESRYDVMIGGQGAAAYAAALYAARYQIKPVVVGEEFGGETAIGGSIENYPGYVDIDGFDLMTKFRDQALKYEVPIVGANVERITKQDGEFLSELSDGSRIRSTAVILAIGRERRKLGLPHEEEWIGKGVSYCSTCDAPLYKGRKAVAVVGGGNAAVEGAILLSKYAKDVYLVYRREKFFRPEPINIRLLNERENLHQVMGTEVVELIGDDEAGLKAIRLSRPFEGKDTYEVDGIFVEIGADPRAEIPQALKVELNAETNEVHVDKMMRTNVPGLFAAGDLTDASGPLKQTVTAAAQGAIAALGAYQYVSEHRSAKAAKAGHAEKKEPVAKR